MECMAEKHFKMCLPAVPGGTLSRRTFLLPREAPAGDTGMPTPGGGYWDYRQRDEEGKVGQR